MHLDLSARRRHRRWWLVPVLAVLLWLGLPRLAALVPAAATHLDRVLNAHYAARLDALQQENFTLHQRLAQSADALTENSAMRQLLGCGRAFPEVVPARVITRTTGLLTLACPEAEPGAPVLDAGGHYAGAVTKTDGSVCTVSFSGVAGLCGSYAGLIQPGEWVLTGLPADCTLTAGDIVTTPDGDWLGTLAAAPAADADGLTAHAPLTDTADLSAAVYFVKK